MIAPAFRSRIRIYFLLLAFIPATLPAADPTPATIIADMKRGADWQIANPSRHPIHDWTQGIGVSDPKIFKETEVQWRIKVGPLQRFPLRLIPGV